MQHIKPLSKGDPLCPLGFHPQVRWPTRCKRCFRDYKEHGNRNREQNNKLIRIDTTASSPSLITWNPKVREDTPSVDTCAFATKPWPNNSKLNRNDNQHIISSTTSSWTSTPNLGLLPDNSKSNCEPVKTVLSRRRTIRSISEEKPDENDYHRTAYNVRRRTASNLTVRPILNERENNIVGERKDDNESDVFTDAASTINTDDTETLMNDDPSALQEIENLKAELNIMRMRCEKMEKEKNDMLLRRVASLDSSISTKTTASELSKLQEKVNILHETCETLQNENKMLTSKLSVLEDSKKTEKNSVLEEEMNSLKSKLQATESLCEELMDENEDMKRELRDMEDEIEEMQDNFRENEADEYSTIKKELEQTGKNCRILSFKLRKCERKAEQLEADKFECERKSREAIQKLQKELDEVNEKLSSIEDVRKKAPMLGNIPKTPSSEKVSRASLTRGGSQEDPVQLLRDLQDSMEREADVREQLRYSEEEAENLRKKISRIEDDNESLLMQLKKMATKAKGCKCSPTYSRLSNEVPVEKDEGISDDDDPAELRLLLELNEQESAVLHNKIKELEETCDILKRKASGFQEKLLVKEQKSSKTRLKETSKNSEAEIRELKNKLQEKERECTQLNSEINSFKRKTKSFQKARSTEDDRDTVDPQRQLKIVEQEASVLRGRICSLEIENEKLQNQNKQLSILQNSKKLGSQTENELRSEVLSLRRQLSEARKLESENSRLVTTLKLVKEGNAEEIQQFFKKRTPKIVTDSVSKDELKKMVQDLECEIAELVLLRNKVGTGKQTELNTNKNSSLVSFELEKTKRKLEKLLNERKEEKAKFEKLAAEKRKLETAQIKQDENKEKEMSVLKKEKERLLQDKKKLMLDIDNFKTQIINLNEDLKSSQSKHNETNDLLAATCRELEEKRSALDVMKKQLESALNSAVEDEKLKTEISEKKKKVVELEKKLLDLEEKNKKSEKLVQVKQEKVVVSLEKEIDSLKKEISALKNSKNNESNREKNSTMKEMEKTTLMKTANVKLTSNNVKKVCDLEKKLSNAQTEIVALREINKKLEVEKKGIEENAQINSKTLESEICLLKANMETLQSTFECERSSMSEVKDELTKQIAVKDTELQTLKKKLLSVGDKKINDVKKELELKINDFQIRLETKQREYDELTNKYEILENEYVKLKSQANSQRDQIQSQLKSTEKELQTLRGVYNSRQDEWIKEKLQLEDRVVDLENQKSDAETYKSELNKQKLLLDAKSGEMETIVKENAMNIDRMEHMRKENEELQKKLDDYDKVINVQRNMVLEASLRESEMRELKARLYNEEQGRKVEVAALKLRYENHVSAISGELKDVQAQVMRFKHERNTYKHLLENAQRAVSEVRNSTNNEEGAGINADEFVEELRNQVATLEQQISCMEDELSEARVESSRLKTELVSERSAWDVRLSEMTSRINELEEERMLNSGRSKTVGLKTRIELSWQKEREEQNRLLQETSTLARDLRQTLFEVERERDKERLEMKRRLVQMKKNADEEQDETRKKIHELQCDLLELRDAHAKLRTTNEKLRREKERIDKEKDLIKQCSKLNSFEYDQKKITYVLQLIGEIFKIHNQALPPVPTKKQSTPNRESSADIKNVSRENSITKDDSNMQLQQILQRLFEAASQVESSKKSCEVGFNKDRARKAFVARGPASTESEEKYNSPRRRGSLYRKCVSLEQTAVSAGTQEQIWRMDEDTDGSVTSIQSSVDNVYLPRQERNRLFDSRLSGGSTHSELSASTLEKKKKKGFLGKLKKITMSSDLSFLTSSTSQENPRSNATISSDQESSKRDLKHRISGFFKSSDSRCNSLDRALVPLNSSDNAGVLESPQRYNETNTLPRRKSAVTVRKDDKSTGGISHSKRKS